MQDLDTTPLLLLGVYGLSGRYLRSDEHWAGNSTRLQRKYERTHHVRAVSVGCQVMSSPFMKLVEESTGPAFHKKKTSLGLTKMDFSDGSG